MDLLVAQWRGIKDQRTHWLLFSFIQGAVERRQNKEFRCNLPENRRLGQREGMVKAVLESHLV